MCTTILACFFATTYINLISCPITFLNFSQIWKRRTSPTCLLRCCIKCLKPSLRSRYISPSNIIEKMSYFSFWLSLICRYVEVNNILFSVSVPCNYARIKLMEKAIGFSAVHCWRMETPWEESITVVSVLCVFHLWRGSLIPAICSLISPGKSCAQKLRGLPVWLF